METIGIEFLSQFSQKPVFLICAIYARFSHKKLLGFQELHSLARIDISWISSCSSLFLSTIFFFQVSVPLKPEMTLHLHKKRVDEKIIPLLFQGAVK